MNRIYFQAVPPSSQPMMAVGYPSLSGIEYLKPIPYTRLELIIAEAVAAAAVYD